MSCCPPGSEPYLAADHKDEGTTGTADRVEYYKVGEGQCGLLIIPDIWGWNSGRTRAIADELATKGGLSVWVPKVCEAYQGGTDGDGLPPDFDLGTRNEEIVPHYFQNQWSPEKVLPQVKKVIQAMKDAGVRKYGLIGFCWGGWIGFHLSKEVPGNELVCGISPHPSVHLEGVLGADPSAVANACQCPWALFPCGVPGGEGADPAIYDKDGDLYKNLERKFPGRNLTKRYEAMKHGFVPRGDLKESGVQEAVVECIQDISEFLQRNSLWRGELEMKVSTKKPPGFYAKAAVAFLGGLEAREAAEGREAQAAKAPVESLKISGLGDAINSAVAAATRAEAEGVGVITKVETSYPEMPSGRGCAQIIISMKRKV